MSFPRLCAYPDVSWIFEESAESGGMRTADENMALLHNRDETAYEQWSRSLFSFRRVNGLINWRSQCAPSKAAICISVRATASAKAGWADMEEQKKKKRKSKKERVCVCLSVWERERENVETGKRKKKKQAKRRKSSLLNNSKKASSWAEADMKCEHHRVVSASVSASHAVAPAWLH